MKWTIDRFWREKHQAWKWLNTLQRTHSYYLVYIKWSDELNTVMYVCLIFSHPLSRWIHFVFIHYVMQSNNVGNEGLRKNYIKNHSSYSPILLNCWVCSTAIAVSIQSPQNFFCLDRINWAISNLCFVVIQYFLNKETEINLNFVVWIYACG